MIGVDRRTLLGSVLVGLAVVLFVVPGLAPVQPVLEHDTRDTVSLDPDELREAGVEVVAYENLTDRGRELYVRALERGGEYRVPQGKGAPDFGYPSDAALRAAVEAGDRDRPGRIVIERPKDDAGLPPADEQLFGERRAGENETEYRERITRYDAVQTRTAQPPLGSVPQLLRLVASLLAVLSMGGGGYLLSSA